MLEELSDMYHRLVASFPVVVEVLEHCIEAWLVAMSSNLVVIAPMLKLVEMSLRKLIPVLDLGSILMIDFEICAFRLSLVVAGLRRAEALLVSGQCFPDLRWPRFCYLPQHESF